MPDDEHPVLALAPERGWSRDDPLPWGGCYQRYAPGKGMLRVVAREGGTYAWYASAKARPDAVSRAQEGFPGAREAMRDADQRAPLLPARMFEALTAGEAQELYRRLARADGAARQGQAPTYLDEVSSELFTHLRILAADPAYHGPEPYEFVHAVKTASYGAWLQAMRVSPNRHSWMRDAVLAQPAARLRRTAASTGQARRRSRQ
jgi:hypothetical protein